MRLEQIQIRQPKPSDLSFIQATFSKCIKNESNLGRSCSPKIFFREFNQVVDNLLSKSEVAIACSQENEDVILGYMIYESDTIHFVFVKSAFRQMGIAKELVEHAFNDKEKIYCSFSTNDSKRIKDRYPNLIFNPFSLYSKGLAA